MRDIQEVTKTFSVSHTASTQNFLSMVRLIKFQHLGCKYFHADVDPDGNELLKEIDFYADELSEINTELIKKLRELVSAYEVWLERKCQKTLRIIKA